MFPRDQPSISAPLNECNQLGFLCNNLDLPKVLCHLKQHNGENYTITFLNDNVIKLCHQQIKSNRLINIYTAYVAVFELLHRHKSSYFP